MKYYTFSVDSALLSELGERLVESVHIALMELIKNAYDADATSVSVEIAQQKKRGPTIRIVDTGVGMTSEQVRTYWMRIATRNKEKNPVSKLYGRPKIGSKGIGRFACRRLGQYLKLTTIAKVRNIYEKTEIEFDWNQFKSGDDVTKIKCKGQSIHLSSAKTGTTLIISKAPEDEWKRYKYDYLKRQLAILVANRGTKREGFNEDPGFNIRFKYPRFEGYDHIVDLRESFMVGGWGLLTGKVSNEGKATYSLDAKGVGKRNIINSNKYPNLKGISFRIAVIPEYPKEQLRNKRLFTKESMKNILDNWGGVQIRYKGFRVYPYGEDDWLDLDKDRSVRKAKSDFEDLTKFAYSLKKVDPSRYLLTALSMRNYFGWIDIDDRAKGFQIKANREGFLKSESFSQLHDVVRFGIDWSTLLRDYYLRIKAKQDSEIAREHLEILTHEKISPDKIVDSAINYVNKEIKNISNLLPPKKADELKHAFTNAKEAILKYDKNNREQLRHLRLISSTSTLVNIFAHEVKSLVGLLDKDYSNLKRIEIKLKGKSADIIKNLRLQLDETKKRFLNLLSMTAMIGVDSRKDYPQSISLYSCIKKACDTFQLIKQAYNIKIDYESGVPKNIIVGPLLESELYAILLNALSNAIKAIIAGTGDKKIKMLASKVGSKIKLNVIDSGIGLPREHWEHVLTPFVADPINRLYPNLEKRMNPEDSYIVGMGTGLGLSIVKDILSLRKGDLSFVKPPKGWSTNLEIILP